MALCHGYVRLYALFWVRLLVNFSIAEYNYCATYVYTISCCLRPAERCLRRSAISSWKWACQSLPACARYPAMITQSWCFRLGLTHRLQTGSASCQWDSQDTSLIRKTSWVYRFPKLGSISLSTPQRFRKYILFGLFLTHAMQFTSQPHAMPCHAVQKCCRYFCRKQDGHNPGHSLSTQASAGPIPSDQPRSIDLQIERWCWSYCEKGQDYTPRYFQICFYMLWELSSGSFCKFS